jgi:TolB-like protein
MLRSKKIFSVMAVFLISSIALADSVIIFNPMLIDGKGVDAGLFNDIVSAELSCSEQIKLVDREQLDKLLRERSLKPNGMLNADDVSNIGSLLGADSFVSGSVREKGDKLMIFVKTISVKTGVVKMKYINVANNLESAAEKTAQTAIDLIKSQKAAAVPVSAIAKLLAPGKKRPVVAIYIPEIHIASQRLIDPAAENELTKIFLEQEFPVKQIAPLSVGKNGLLDDLIGNRTTLVKAAKNAGADYLIFGEAVSESSDAFGNYRTSRARVITSASSFSIRASVVTCCFSSLIWYSLIWSR